MNKYRHVEHTFGPVYDSDSRILILGSFPSVKSREINFYYGHRNNRFWKILGMLFNEEIEDKMSFLLKHHIALFDVIESCDIIGSSDASIQNVKPNDLSIILNNSKIKTIYLNGSKAYELYNRFCKDKYSIKTVRLPSTSPANAAYSIDDLFNEWKIIRTDL
ncbi:MAG: DNA-deoxyinosine glycosylase [Erysipelotrichaceae bacterium]|nr:DNA-deoxyinosine glycosylase [Erysipelotrichaceae bacterium]